MSEDLTLEVSQKMCLYSQTKGAVQEVVANGAVVGGLVVVADLQVVAWGKRVFSRPLLRIGLRFQRNINRQMREIHEYIRAVREYT